MRRHLAPQLLAAAVALCVVGCSSDSRCSLANCTALLACHLELAGQPQNLGQCVQDNAFTSAVGMQLQSYCPEACEADNQGAIVACVAAHFGNGCQLPDGGGPVPSDIVEATCVSQLATPCGPNCQSCLTKCQSGFNSCQTACPTTDATSCLDCGYSCNQEWGIRCVNDCPET